MSDFSLPKLSFLSPEVDEFLRKSFKCQKNGLGSDDLCTNCESWFDSLLKCLGKPPLYTTVRVNTLKTTVHDARIELVSVLEKQCKDRDWPSFTIYQHPTINDVLVIPCSGPISSPLSTKEVIVDLHCGTALLRGADVFAPGVIGANPCIREGDMVSVFADLDGKCRKGFAKPYLGSKLFVGNGKAVMSRDDIFCNSQPISGVAIKMTSPLYKCPSLSGILPGLIFPQNLPSIVVGHVLDPQPGETVLDMCAAPGGKTTHIASLMNNKGSVIAFDKSLPKVQKIQTNCQSLGVVNVRAFVFDASKSLDKNLQNWTIVKNDDISVPPYPPESFDRILLDAPCSALGQRPQSVVKMTIKNLRSFPILQKKIFPAAVGLLKEEGTLVYSTCTITVEENELLVAWVLESFPCMHLVSQTPHLGSPGLPYCGLSEEQRKLVQRFDPSATQGDPPKESHDVDTIGFFVAKFIKRTQTL